MKSELRSGCAVARVGAAICAMLMLAGAALETRGQMITFETTPAGGVPTDDAPLPFGTPYTIAGVQVAFGFDVNSDGVVESDAVFERAGTFQGETLIGFVGSNGVDTADAGFAPQLGQWFLRSQTPGSSFGRFVIQYTSSSPVTAASGEIWDIDGQPSIPATEQYTVQAFDAANMLLATQVSPLGVGDTATAPLDGQPWTFSFSGLSNIDHIWVTFTGSKTSGIGLAFNNFRPTSAIPEPGGLALALAAIVATAARQRRRNLAKASS